MEEIKTKPLYETNYQVKCRMSVDDGFFVAGYARTEADMNELVTRMKKTWRYVECSSYEARIWNTEESRKGKARSRK